MNKENYPALGAVVLTVISLFLPWVEVSVAGGVSDLTAAPQLITVSGISIGYGLIGLLVILLGGFLAYKEYKWAFVAGIINVIDGYGYLKGWFGASTHDSGNYGDISSKSSIDYKSGLYLFIIASVAFLFITLKKYKAKSTEAVTPSEPDVNVKPQPAYATTNTVSSPEYKPSKIETMTTVSSEIPTEPKPDETPIVPVQDAETAAQEPIVVPTVTEPVAETPSVTVQPPVTPNPVQAAVPQPAPVIIDAPKVTVTPQQPVSAPEKKKSSTTKVLLIILAIVVVGTAVLTLAYNASLKSKDKTEQSVNDEKARLQVVINDVNQTVSDKKYDDALLKVNSINWLYEPDANKGYVDQYNSQRENLRKTIEQLKIDQTEEDQTQAAQKASEATQPPVTTTDSVH